MHLSPEFGLTVRSIEGDGFEISERVEMLLSADSPASIAKSMGIGLLGFGQVFDRNRPDILVVMGDRFEMLAAGLAALPFKIPLAHISGGELSEGAIDDSLRHSLTKLSHLHFTATEEYARRVIQMGEDPKRVFACGEPTLDFVTDTPKFTSDELKRKFDVDVERQFLLVTFHSTTLEYEQTERQIDQLLFALEDAALPVICTMPNADTAGRIIGARLRDWITPQRGKLVENLETSAYHSIMARAVALVGNSSSGIIEAASFRTPVVNVGTRQQGRLRPQNVVDVSCVREEILAGIKKVKTDEFRDSLQSLMNPYASKNRSATSSIVQVLKRVELGDVLIRKRFYDFIL
jgi:UDP-N-acetylglucosamine 2-epimerase (non-hydrolysing)/GDP/UDP-N,N'-diacetylbacillosamine 2-epimerase (hydrolysing)